MSLNMKKNQIHYLVICLIAIFGNSAHSSNASEFEVGDTRYKINGGVSGNIQYLDKSASQIGEIGTAINDIVLALKPVRSGSPVVFHAAIGQLQQQDIFHTTAPLAPLELGVLYGFFDVNISKSVSFQAGQINNLLSYESPISFKNDNILVGAIQRSNATYYPGFRFILFEKSLNLRLFAEYSGPDDFNSEQISIGVLKKHKHFDVTAGYANGIDAHNTFALNIKVNHFKRLPFGISYIQKAIDDTPSQFDKPARAVGVFFKPSYKQYTTGIRIEYIDDGDTDFYGFAQGYTITVSPSKQLSKHITMRIDLVYATADGKAFGFEESSQYGFAFQLNWVF